jgi:hypothetical protein
VKVYDGYEVHDLVQLQGAIKIVFVDGQEAKSTSKKPKKVPYCCRASGILDLWIRIKLQLHGM